MTAPAVVAIDQGTTSTRAIAFDRTRTPVAIAQRELPQSYPVPGWVEHDPERIRDGALRVTRDVIEAAEVLGHRVEAIGLTNQRETTVVWERATAHETLIARGPALRLDPYSSGTKLAWILDNVPDAREAAERGDLAFGTVDSWLLWCLTECRVSNSWGSLHLS